MLLIIKNLTIVLSLLAKKTTYKKYNKKKNYNSIKQKRKKEKKIFILNFKLHSFIHFCPLNPKPRAHGVSWSPSQLSLDCPISRRTQGEPTQI